MFHRLNRPEYFDVPATSCHLQPNIYWKPVWVNAYIKSVHLGMTDYVVRPKRRRNGAFKAVDPCLGYYIPLPRDTHPGPETMRQLPDGGSNREMEKKAETAATGGKMAVDELDVGPDVDSLSCADELDRLHRQENRDYGSGSDSDGHTVTRSRCRNRRRIVASPPSSPSSSLQWANADWAILIPGPVAALSRDVNRTRPHQASGTSSPKPYDHVQKEPQSETLTVEAFLKRSAQKTYTSKRKRGRQKRVLHTKLIAGGLESEAHEEQHNREDERDNENVYLNANTIQLRSREIIRALSPTSPGFSSDISSDMETETERLSGSRNSSSPSSKTKKYTKSKKTSKKKSKSLRKRIYEAAISTHVDPDPYFACSQKAGSVSTRIPLRFVPGVHVGSIGGSETHSSKRVMKMKKRSFTLIDPRKSVGIRTAAFSSKIRPPNLAFNNVQNVLPSNSRMTGKKTQGKWKWDPQLGAPMIGPKQQFLESKVEAKKERIKQDVPETKPGISPLVFIPMLEAEASYSSLFRGRGARPAEMAQPEKRSRLKTGPVKTQANRSSSKGTE
uniref:Uncharacterized protein n=1 Tax=Psilocybe cubensis TaxID=181762 RepID=A0A8H8CM40_PSICU